jgi:hypothetical protein
MHAHCAAAQDISAAACPVRDIAAGQRVAAAVGESLVRRFVVRSTHKPRPASDLHGVDHGDEQHIFASLNE